MAGDGIGIARRGRRLAGAARLYAAAMASRQSADAATPARSGPPRVRVLAQLARHAAAAGAGRRARSARSRAQGRAAPSASFTPAGMTPGSSTSQVSASPASTRLRGGGPECLRALPRPRRGPLGAAADPGVRGYPNVRALLPDVPDPSLQELWNGAERRALAEQSEGFYCKLCQRFGRLRRAAARRGSGCSTSVAAGGGSTRFVARDVRPGRLYGCDRVGADPRCLPDERACLQPLRRRTSCPSALPFERAVRPGLCVLGLHPSLRGRATSVPARSARERCAPARSSVVTIRPPEYLRSMPAHARPRSKRSVPMRGARLTSRVPLRGSPGRGQRSAVRGRRDDLRRGGRSRFRMCRERWSRLFDLLDVDLLIGDPTRSMLTLRRR